MFEDGEGIPQVKFLIDDGGGVGLDAVVCEVFFGLGEEAGGGGGLGQVPEGEEGEGDGAAAFDDEEVAPVGQVAGFDLEDAEGEEASEGGGDALGGVEEGEAAGEFVTAVEAGVCEMLAQISLLGRDDCWEEMGEKRKMGVPYVVR